MSKSKYITMMLTLLILVSQTTASAFMQRSDNTRNQAHQMQSESTSQMDAYMTCHDEQPSLSNEPDASDCCNIDCECSYGNCSSSASIIDISSFYIKKDLLQLAADTLHVALHNHSDSLYRPPISR